MLFIETLKFNSIEELYKRLKPALKCKESELVNLGYNYINEVDIWNALKNDTWRQAADLSLNEMVNDILNTPASFFDNYLKKTLSQNQRSIDLEDNLL